MHAEVYDREQQSTLVMPTEQRAMRREESAKSRKWIRALCFEPQNQSTVINDD